MSHSCHNPSQLLEGKKKADELPRTIDLTDPEPEDALLPDNSGGQSAVLGSKGTTDEHAAFPTGNSAIEGGRAYAALGQSLPPLTKWAAQALRQE